MLHNDDYNTAIYLPGNQITMHKGYSGVQLLEKHQ